MNIVNFKKEEWCTNVCQQEGRLNLELHAAFTQEALEARNRQRNFRLLFSTDLLRTGAEEEGL